MADEICKFLNYPPKLISQVYVSWARAKIEAQIANEERDNESDLANLIYEKLKDEKNISFAEIARKAVEIGKNRLALDLLQKEKSSSKKIQVLLEMKNYAHALKDSLASKDSNLIEMVVYKMCKDSAIDHHVVWTSLEKNAISRTLLINYLKNFSPGDLMEFILHHGKSDDRALHAVGIAAVKESIDDKVEILKKVAVKGFKDKCYEDMTKEHLEFLDWLKKEGKPEMSMKDCLEDMFAAGRDKEAEVLKKKFKITDRSYYTMKARALIRVEKWPELETFILEKNKKSAIVPWFTLVDMLMDAGQKTRIDKYVLKMNDPEEQIAILKMAQLYTTAADVASINKRFEVLDDLLQNPNLTEEQQDYVRQVRANPRKR